MHANLAYPGSQPVAVDVVSPRRCGATAGGPSSARSATSCSSRLPARGSRNFSRPRRESPEDRVEFPRRTAPSEIRQDQAGDLRGAGGSTGGTEVFRRSDRIRGRRGPAGRNGGAPLVRGSGIVRSTPRGVRPGSGYEPEGQYVSGPHRNGPVRRGRNQRSGPGVSPGTIGDPGHGSRDDRGTGSGPSHAREGPKRRGSPTGGSMPGDRVDSRPRGVDRRKSEGYSGPRPFLFSRPSMRRRWE